jgi:hypothetical protein
MQETTSIIKISDEVHRVVKHLANKHSVTMRGLVSKAVEHYKKTWKDRAVSGDKGYLPTIHPYVYPRESKPLHIAPEDKEYIDQVASKQLGNSTQNIDTIIITYQNIHAQDVVPPWLRLKWLDKEYTEWLKSLPEEFK